MYNNGLLIECKFLCIKAFCKFFNLYHKSLLNLVKSLLLFGLNNKRDSITFSLVSSSSSNSMQVSITPVRHVVVNNKIDSLNINSSCHQVSSNSNSFFTFFELRIAINSVNLTHV